MPITPEEMAAWVADYEAEEIASSVLLRAELAEENR